MKTDLITTYMSYKLARLTRYAKAIVPDEDKKILTKCYNLYLQTYLNTYYYHILGTLDKASTYTYPTIEKEIAGLKLELLDDLKNYENVIEKAKYQLDIDLINKGEEIILFVTKLDNLKDPATLITIIKETPNITKYLSKSTVKDLTNLIKGTNKDLDNFFKDLSLTSFPLNYHKLMSNDNLSIVSLNYQIKQLAVNYKASQVNRVFNSSLLEENKTEILINNLSKDILLKLTTNEEIPNYIIEFYPVNFTPKEKKVELFNLLNNKILKDHITIGIDYDTYQNNKEYLTTLKHTYACYQDMTHIPDVKDKLNILDALNFFTYVIITDYKDKDLEAIEKYSPTNIKEIIIKKGE
jgi:hypothetical protein